jgi:ornithine cyclodeaminase/alanine dehydrogenase-like protein (mu-crystallin family)
VLSDPETGLPVAVMDGTITSAMRTGAVTGIGARLLAREGARTAGILGAGVQARTQLAGLEAALPSLRRVLVWDIDPARSKAFAESSKRVVPVGSAEEACEAADVVVAATMAPAPYVRASWLSPGSLFISVSSLDPEVACIAQSDLLVCDVWDRETEHASRPFARALADGLVTREEVVELPAIVTGRDAGRTDQGQRVFFSPVGLAIEDVAAAARVYRNARHIGVGTQLALWQSPIWV